MEFVSIIKTRSDQAKIASMIRPAMTLLFLASCSHPNSDSMMHRGAAESVSGSAEDVRAIERAYQNWYTAWESKDYKLASQDYSDDAVWVNAFGMKRIGREEIEETLKMVFEMDFVMVGTSKTVEKTIKFIDEDIALVTSRVERVGQQTRAGAEFARKTSHLRVFVKSGGRWQIVSHLISDARNRERPEH